MGIDDTEINRLREIDAICETFEQAWVSGRQPQIEDYVRSAHNDTATTLWQELVLIELQRMRASGRSPSEGEYRRRFPELSHLIRPQWFQIPAEVQATLCEGELVDGFMLKHEIGRGASGVVWLASDEVLQRDVALKFLVASTPDDERPGSALYEARVAALLDHPRIVAVYGKGSYHQWDYIVSKYIAGQPLNRWALPSRSPFQAVARIFMDIADAVDYAHQRKIIHRDLKPANIVVDGEGCPFIADFGIAKRTDWETSEITRRQLIGTPGYMSPEQASGQCHRVDHRSDIYSIGAMMYEMLTGAKPYRGTPSEVMQATISKEFTAPRQIDPRIPRALERICSKCLQKKPSLRYSTAAELKAELCVFLNGHGHASRLQTMLNIMRDCAHLHYSPLTMGKCKPQSQPAEQDVKAS